MRFKSDERWCNRLAKLRVDADLLDEKPDVALLALSRCLILRAELLFHANQIEYVAASPDFGVSHPGCELPYYHAVFETDAYGTTTFLRFEPGTF